MKLTKPTKEHMETHYEDLKTKKFFPGLIEYMTSAPVVAMVWEGKNVVLEGRKMLGKKMGFMTPLYASPFLLFSQCLKAPLCQAKAPWALFVEISALRWVATFATEVMLWNRQRKRLRCGFPKASPLTIAVNMHGSMSNPR